MGGKAIETYKTACEWANHNEIQFFTSRRFAEAN
jgi:hypothetical protein